LLYGLTKLPESRTLSGEEWKTAVYVFGDMASYNEYNGAKTWPLRTIDGNKFNICILKKNCA